MRKILATLLLLSLTSLVSAKTCSNLFQWLLSPKKTWDAALFESQRASLSALSLEELPWSRWQGLSSETQIAMIDRYLSIYYPNYQASLLDKLSSRQIRSLKLSLQKLKRLQGRPIERQSAVVRTLIEKLYFKQRLLPSLRKHGLRGTKELWTQQELSALITSQVMTRRLSDAAAALYGISPTLAKSGLQKFFGRHRRLLTLLAITAQTILTVPNPAQALATFSPLFVYSSGLDFLANDKLAGVMFDQETFRLFDQGFVSEGLESVRGQYLSLAESNIRRAMFKKVYMAFALLGLGYIATNSANQGTSQDPSEEQQGLTNQLYEMNPINTSPRELEQDVEEELIQTIENTVSNIGHEDFWVATKLYTLKN